jgi:hypothetical protein
VADRLSVTLYNLLVSRSTTVFSLGLPKIMEDRSSIDHVPRPALAGAPLLYYLENEYRWRCHHYLYLLELPKLICTLGQEQHTSCSSPCLKIWTLRRVIEIEVLFFCSESRDYETALLLLPLTQTSSVGPHVGGGQNGNGQRLRSASWCH